MAPTTTILEGSSPQPPLSFLPPCRLRSGAVNQPFVPEIAVAAGDEVVDNAVRAGRGALDNVTVARRRQGAIAEVVLHQAIIFYAVAENDGVPGDGRQTLGEDGQAAHVEEEAVVADARQWRSCSCSRS